MVDTPTKLSDVIIPEVFNPYYREQVTRVNAFFRSGIMTNVPDLNFGERGGIKIAMPFWKALNNRAQLIDDNYDLDLKKIETGQDEAVQHARALPYAGSDIAAALAGSDPMEAIAAGVAENWSYEFNMQAIATVKGAMAALAAEGSPKNTLDISAASGAAAYIDGASFIDANQQMGDAKDNIAGVLMHSAVEAYLAKQDLIEFIRDSEGKVRLRQFMGKEVIVDDAITPSTGTYTTVLFGPGALGFGEGNPKVPSEVDRQPLKGGGMDILVTRRHYVIHPRGIAWAPASGVPAKTTPSDAELAAAGNWSRVWDPKNIRIVMFKHKIG